ncbi:fluoride efflux transporter CrcB [Sporosarcina sp. Te-1]|uniref:fluoride efflux transporter CrcB n=1 Tax=Sporosarcina sp. Te-1 TaxID=2818390 RepID=UPI001A9D3784|nr:fluoride efflux transporter CrcB [Sporosarcina sp. Te-1]QTD42649.1 fluoride efflux transporter CrcB [Sporosarcina sp. Te-1]
MRTGILVGIAGAFGAICRYGLGRFVLPLSIGFPLGTFTVNIIGSFMMTFLAAGAIQRITSNSSMQTAITTGFIGSFTTFSALSIETVTLIQGGNWQVAFLYIMSSFVGGLGMAAVGQKWGLKSCSFYNS